MWIVVLIIMALIIFFLYKFKSNVNKSYALDIETGVNEAFNHGNLAETVLTERDKERMYVCMGMISLKAGFTSARQMKNLVEININDYNILALIFASFYIMQLAIYMDSISKERIQTKFPKKLAGEIQKQIDLERELIIKLYAKAGYDKSINKIVIDSVLIYSSLGVTQSELLMMSLIGYEELFTNEKINLKDDISLRIFCHTAYTTMVPGYLSSMSRLIDHFYGYTLPIVDKLNAN